MDTPGTSSHFDEVVTTFRVTEECLSALRDIGSRLGTNETVALHIAVFATQDQVRRKSSLIRRALQGGKRGYSL